MTQAAIWGVLDGELVTDFPDIWSKTLVSSEHGSVLIVPRERNMTRLYIELKLGPKSDRRELGQEFIMQRAKKIMAPFEIDWKYLEWFGRYQIGQRVANRFSDAHFRAFLAGDASHTHSPKSAQGMNTSMHDSWNLAWKLNFAVRGLAKPCLLQSYEEERRKIALDLVNFDYEHAYQIAGGDALAVAESFKTNVRFMSGIGAEYSENVINRADNQMWIMGEAKPGCLLPPAKVTRYIDSNPVDIQLDIPMMGQFRIYLLMWDVQQAGPFLETFCLAIASRNSFISKLSAAASASYAVQARLPGPDDIYQRPERYTAVSHLFTFAMISRSPWVHPYLSFLCDANRSQRLCPRATSRLPISRLFSKTRGGHFTWTIYPNRTPRASYVRTSGLAAWDLERWPSLMSVPMAMSALSAGGTPAWTMQARRPRGGLTSTTTASCSFQLNLRRSKVSPWVWEGTARG
jgi:phenol 2-monooxygenase (NADPH)